MTHSPCYTCARRTLLCHAQCTAYHDWTASIRAEKAALNADREINAHTKAVTNRIRKRRNIK